jgi:DNA-binding NarL/FixJ family response regulator
MAEVLDSAQIRIVLVEDDKEFLEALRAVIALVPDMLLVCVAETKAQALLVLEQAPVDVLLVDLGLPDGSGIDVIAAARACWPECAIMVSTTFGDEMHVIRSIEAGANGYLLKDSAANAIVEEIRSLHRGGSPISPLIARHVLMRFRLNGAPAVVPNDSVASSAAQAPERAPTAVLSAREKEVLDFITKGFTYDEIAGLMGVSRYTVMTFVRRIYAKLEVKSKAEAIYEARMQGLLAD